MNRLLVPLLVLVLVPPGVCDERDRPTSAFRLSTVMRGSIEAAVPAVGTLEPEEVVDVSARVTGAIQKFGADPRDPTRTIDYGSQVEEGTVLAQIDPTTYQIQVEQARAGLRRARAELQLASAQAQVAERDWSRVKQLGDKDLSPADRSAYQIKHELGQANLDVSKAGVHQAEVALRLAEHNLAACAIKSPIRGVIIDRRVNLGQVVGGAGAPSLFLVARDLRRLQVWASVSEADIGQVRKGQAVRFTTLAFPGKSFRGEVAQVRLNATLTRGVVSYPVVIAVDNPDGKLVPYLTAEVQIAGERRDNVLLVPNDALRWRPQPGQVAPEVRKSLAVTATDRDSSGRGVVWVEDKGFVRPVKVRVGLTDFSRTEILGGDLAEGTDVVVGERPADRDQERGQGPPAEARRMLAAEATTLLVQPGAGAGATFGASGVNTLTAANAEAIVRECPAVLSAAPAVRLRTQLVHGKRSWVPLYIYGTTPSFLKVRDWEKLQEGSPFTDRDVRAGARVCLVGRTIARELFGDVSPVGKDIRFLVEGASFQVVGVLERKGSNVMGLDQDDILLAPWTAVAAIRSAAKPKAEKKTPEGDRLLELYPAPAPPVPKPSNGVDQIVVRARSEADVPAASRQISELLRKRHRISRGQPDDFNVRDLGEMARALRSGPSK